MQILSVVLLLAALAVSLSSATHMVRYGVDDKDAVCNDGSPYVFYFAPGNQTDKWLIFFNGGAWCFDKVSCDRRMIQSPNLMSSKGYGATEDHYALFDDRPAHNPLFAGYNKVFLPYCTSDDFSGAQKEGNPWIFQGSRAAPATIEVLLKRFGLVDSVDTTVVVAGSSAGGEALYPNIDNINELYLPKSRVVGIDDSGWFLYTPPFAPRPNCTDAGSCTEAYGISHGVPYWNGQMNTRCAQAHSKDDVWKCLMGPTVGSFIRTPMFVFQYLFDAAQLGHDGMGNPTPYPDQLIYAQNSAFNLTVTTEAQKWVFHPSCYQHTILFNLAWTTISIDGVTLVEALQSFLLGKPIRLIDKCRIPNCNPTCP